MKKFKRIAVIGEGKMGTSIFLYLNGFDFQLSWLCSSDSEKEKAIKTFQKKTKLLFQSGILSETEYESKLNNITITASLDDLSNCELIIEAISEDLAAKRKLFETLDNTVNAHCIFATNSSSFIPSQLITSGKRKDKIGGLHFFFPVPLKNTIELITNSSTSLQTKELLKQFLEQINKKAFNQDESHAFILNRLLLDFQAEAFHVLMEGILTVKEIDELVKFRIFPIGVFEFFDHVGIDIMLSSVKSYTQNASNKEFYMPMIQKMAELVKLNQLGIKTKHGFYDYSHPVETSIIPNNTTIEASEYKNKIANRLWNSYIRSVLSVIDSGFCTQEELSFFVKDYLGMDNDPFTLLN